MKNEVFLISLFIIVFLMGCLGSRSFKKVSEYSRPVGFDDFGTMDMAFELYDVSNSEIHYYVGSTSMTATEFDELVFSESEIIKPREIRDTAVFVTYLSFEKIDEEVFSLLWHSEGKLYQIGNSASTRDLEIMIDLFNYYFTKQTE